MKSLNLRQKAKRIKLLLLDVDGVLTDGRIIYDSQGRDLKIFDVQDGMGIHLLSKMGIKTILVSARGSNTIHRRAKDMSVFKVFENSTSKLNTFKKILNRLHLKPFQVCFVGDDLVDLAAMKRAGLKVAVKNACIEVRRMADYITKKPGSRGAVREIAELLLKSQKKWQRAVSDYR